VEDAGTPLPMVKLGIKGRDADGYPLSRITVR
jgi:hypothetical protein